MDQLWESQNQQVQVQLSKSTEIKIVHAVTKMVTSYQGDELEAIRIGAKQTFLQKTYICLWTAKQQYKPSGQNHKNYHDITDHCLRNKTKPQKYQPQHQINQICILPSPYAREQLKMKQLTNWQKQQQKKHKPQSQPTQSHHQK